MSFGFSKTSIKRMEGLHPDLQRVIYRALELSTQDFSIIEGVRTIEQQRKNVAKGASQTMNSQHLPKADGYGYAVDVAAYISGKGISWDLEYYYLIAEAFEKAAKELNITIRWGGAWVILNTLSESPKQVTMRYSEQRRSEGRKAFIDAGHFELRL